VYCSSFSGEFCYTLDSWWAWPASCSITFCFFHNIPSYKTSHAEQLKAATRPWLRCGHGTACRDLSHRYLHWRPLDVSWRRNCSSEVFLISTALPTTASDRYSVLTLRRTHVLSLSLAFVWCPCSLLTLRHLKSFLSMIWTPNHRQKFSGRVSCGTPQRCSGEPGTDLRSAVPFCQRWFLIQLSKNW